MNKFEREDRLLKARQAAVLMLGPYAIGEQPNALLGPDHREHILALITEFDRLDRKERRQREAGRKGAKFGHLGAEHGIKGGRPTKKKKQKKSSP